MIKFNKVGQIIKGDDAGQFIEVVNEDGSYYIYQSNVRDFSSDETFDAWLENESALKGFFEESGWVIDWDI